MKADPQHSMNGHAPPPVALIEPNDDLSGLRAANARQAHVIETLTTAVSRMRTGATALRADNTYLRAEVERLRGFPEVRKVEQSAELVEWADIRLGVDKQAPAIARAVLVSTLGDQVPASLLERAVLLASELVTNSVRHGGASPGDALVFRVELSSAVIRLEVGDPGRAGMIAPRAPDLANGGGFGLHIVDVLSESWGVERSSTGTRVWARLTTAP
jgi:anti-sigma regulatory factor (Ser/Thr protein kinase)